MNKKSLQELNLLDRFLFAEASEDREFLETVLSIILDSQITLKHLPQAEREIRGVYGSKKIRIDVWCEDEKGRVYDIEAQSKDTGNLPKRSRYYQGLMDSKLMPEGDIDYNNIKDIYIILISPFDLFGKGKYLYCFSMKDEENEVDLRDGAMRIFLNTRGCDRENVSDELVSLLKYFEETTEEVAVEGSERIKLLHRKITAIKENNNMGVKYMNAWEEKLLERQAGFEEGEAAGLNQGILQGIGQVAIQMLRKGKEKSEIIEMTGLSMEEIEALDI